MTTEHSEVVTYSLRVSNPRTCRSHWTSYLTNYLESSNRAYTRTTSQHAAFVLLHQAEATTPMQTKILHVYALNAGAVGNFSSSDL